MSTSRFAQIFKTLHQRPGRPLVLANVHDRLSARAVAELSTTEALGTTSFAIARAADTTDDELTLDVNLAAIEGIAAVARELGKPLTVDIQDGYGERLEEAIDRLVKMGVAGINLEDYDNEARSIMDIETATRRVRRALEAARDHGVEEFVVNARCDVLVRGGRLEEVLERGKKYLEAGATTVFVWGGKRGVTASEVVQLVTAFHGKLNVLLNLSPDGLTIRQLAHMGVARISVGPTLQSAALAMYRREAEKLVLLPEA